MFPKKLIILILFFCLLSCCTYTENKKEIQILKWMERRGVVKLYLDTVHIPYETYKYRVKWLVSPIDTQTINNMLYKGKKR